MGFGSIIGEFFSNFKKPICIFQLEIAVGFIHSFLIEVVLDFIVLLILLSFKIVARVLMLCYFINVYLLPPTHVLQKSRD